MNQETQKLVREFLEECNNIDEFGYTSGVFVAHLNYYLGSFHYEFKKFNEKNGIRFDYTNLSNNLVVIQEK